MTADKNELITIPAAAKLLNVGHMTVRRWIEAGRLTPVNEKNPLLEKTRLLLRRSDVEALLTKPQK